LIGRPRQLYADTVYLLNEVAENRESAEDLLTDAVRLFGAAAGTSD